jgi:hypothetical protein
MDEQKWLSSDSVYSMVRHLRLQCGAARKKFGRRKLRLFMVACFRDVWDILDERSSEIVEAVELAADVLNPIDGDRTPLYGDAVKVWQQIGYNQAGFRYCSCRALLEITNGYASPGPAAYVVSEFLCQALVFPYPPLSDTHPLLDRTQNVSRRRHAELVREVFGNPFRPLPKSKFPAEVVGLAQACYDDHSHYPLLADALDDLGEPEMAAHCRLSGHVRGCHVVDRIMGME